MAGREQTPPNQPANRRPETAEEGHRKRFDFLRNYTIEDYVCLLVFWALAAVVFAQFFTRYVLNASLFWTEEIARYLLIAVGFLGSVIAVRKRSHIFVEVFYRFLPKAVGRVMSTLVDIIKVVFFGIGAYLSIRIFPIMAQQRMASVALPMTWVYAPVLAGFVIMTLRSIQIGWEHWRSGFIPVVNDPNNPLPEDIPGKTEENT